MSNVYNINESGWESLAIDLKAKGMSTRGVARTLFKNENLRNRLNEYFKKEEVIEAVYHRECELSETEIKSEIISGVSGNDYTDWIAKEKPPVNSYSMSEDHYYTFDLGLKKTILVIADTQCKSEENLEYMLWIGHYIADKKPDIIVHIGDHYDFPSLSSYDKGKASAEGRRLVKDIEAGNAGFEFLNLAIEKVKDYNPRKVFCLGNHEYRLERYIDDNPELIGTLGVDKLPFAKYGWEVHPFLKPVEINGVFFVHYLANPFSGKPYGGNAMNILKTVGRSFVVGHKQCLDIAIRPTIDGKQQIGIVNGACYPFDESYKGYQGNNHFRGLTVLHEVEDGFGLPMFVSLEYMKEKYYN